MFFCDDVSEPSLNFVSNPPKMLGCDELRAAEASQSSPPVIFREHDPPVAAKFSQA
jgi:hypothetical protein